MSLKSALDHRRPRGWSLAALLTTFYAFSAFAIVVLATGFLHWAMVRNVTQISNQLLTDRIQLVRSLMQEHAFDVQTVVRLVGEGPASRDPAAYLVRVMDASGRTIAESPGMVMLPRNQFPSPGDGTTPDIAEVDVQGRTYRLMSATAGSKTGFHGLWTIQVALDRTGDAELIRGSQRNARIALGAAFLACVLAGYLIARRGIRPVEDITRTAAAISANTLERRLDAVPLPRELRQLAETFNAMLDRLQHSFTQLSQFSADIAHELRTPVNNLRGEIDVALNRPRSSEHYVNVLGSALEECDRLTRLIESLLFLARAEHPQSQLERSTCCLRDELQTVADFFRGQADEQQIAIQVQASEGVSAALHRPLFQRAIGNLLANALAYTPAGGTVSLRAFEQGAVIVEVQDTGSGIAQEHLPQLFDRFYRADPSRTKASGGMGLGLAIVKGIVELHGGSIEADSTPAEGTTIRIALPKQVERAAR